MDVREKLVELIEEARLLASETLGSMNRGFGGWYADYLIANGVTVQEWIPVTERLPEPFVEVLVFRDGDIKIDYYEENGWFAFDLNGKRATHWMHLPEPPKGE